MTAHHTYGPHASPFLPLTSGRFEFDRASHPGNTPGVEVCQLTPLALGDLVMPSGHLVVSDPFNAMQRQGNHFVRVPPGRHPAFVTLANINPEKTPVDERSAYLSLAIDPTALAARQAWQQRRMEVGQDPSLPRHALRFLHLTGDGNPPDDLASFEPDEFIGVTVQAVTVAFVDAESLEKGMPEETREHDWLTTLFAPGAQGSWFDLMDDANHLHANVANVVLPRVFATEWGPANLVMSHSGWGNDVYPVIGEYAFDLGDGTFDQEASPRLVAVHVNFNIVPCSNSPVENEPV